MKKTYRTCHLCEAMCGLAITTDGGRIVDIRGDEEDPFSRGHLCPKGAALGELRDDPDRLRTPRIRCPDGTFREASWDEALDLVGSTLASLQRKHGGDSVAIYLGNPNVHNHGAILFAQALFRTLRTRNRYDANSLDANPRLLACQLMYGDATAVPVPDVDRTDYLLMLGANPAASNGSLMSLGDVRGRLKGLSRRGARFVLVDPRRTETAEWADEHVFIRPGTDAAFVLSLLQVILSEGRFRPELVAVVADGLAALTSLVAPFTPARVARVTGIAEADIVRIAREFAAAPRAVAYGRIGTCLQEHGTVASWAIDALNVVTGRFDVEGGLMFAEPPIDFSVLARRLKVAGHARWRSRVKGLPELAGQLPVATLPDEIETPGHGQVRALICIAGNPVRSAPDSGRFERAFQKLELLVSVDPYINETSRLAHVILPPADALERPHMDVVLQAFAVRNTARYSPPVFEKPRDSRHDWEIIAALGERLGGLRFGNRALDTAVRAAGKVGLRFTPEHLVDLLLRIGPYGASLSPLRAGLTLARLEKSPHGIDLGPLRPGGRVRRVLHPGHRVQLVPPPIAAEVARIGSSLDTEGARGLLLVGRRHVRSNNSWLHNLPSLTGGRDRTSLFIHPRDGQERGLVEGAHVEVASAVGTLRAQVHLTDAVMPGVVCLPHGFGHQGVKATLTVAGQTDAPNFNAITDVRRLDTLSGTAALNGTPVSVHLLPETP